LALTPFRRAVRVAIALGSNLGDRERYLHVAVEVLRSHVDDMRVSSFHETAYVGEGEAQPAYLNAAVVGDTPLSPRQLLSVLLTIEHAYGRQRPTVNAPRTLDLDLVLYEEFVLDEPGLVVPHPRFRERRFVLEPLCEIAADWHDPVTGRTVDELLRARL
jgi:2-amino-4-hydroxy-6-hydroxymethyldihydropteridine diphosphokinase